MHKLISTLSLFLIVACGTKEKSEIKVTHQSKGLTDKHGDGKYITEKIYLPLTSDLIEYYDRNTVLGEKEKLDNKRKYFGVSSVLQGLKLGFMNLGMNALSKNFHSIQSSFKFDYLDPDYIKEIRVKSVFFHIEPCNPEKKECQSRVKDKKLNFNFMEELFLDFSPNYGATELEATHSFLNKREFKKKSTMAFRPLFDNYSAEDSKLDTHMMSDFKNITVARYGKDKSENFVEDVILFKVRPDMLTEVRNLLKYSSKLSRYVDNVELIGDNVYIKLKNFSMMKRFEGRFINEVTKQLGSDVLKSESLKCTKERCINFDTNDVNLMPILEHSPHVNINTFLSINKISFSDFEYRGLIELEIKLEPGI